jgi:hypothetical protein
MVNIVGISALKGAVDGAIGKKGKGKGEGEGKGEGKEGTEVKKPGKFMRAVDWVTQPKKVPGWLVLWPLWLTRKAVEATVEGYNIVDGTAVAVGQKVGGTFIRPIKETGEGTIKLGEELGSETIKLGSNLVLNPALEIAKANFVEFPRRAIVDPFKTGLKMAFGIPGAFVDRSIEAAKRTLLSPVTIVRSCRDALKEVFWNAPKNLYDYKFKEAGKSLLRAPYEIAKGVLDAPLAIAGVPYHTAMEAGLGGLEMVRNGTRAMVAPVEGLVNSYRSMAKSKDFIEFIKRKAGVDQVKSYRQRFGDLFRFQSPLAAVAGA